ncbi:MAG: NIL domain-containing protein [Thermodesulfobacteriota bacterium]|nr:NIL domain-containing protein [Thermodesulfobacteriota bacterium]
MEKKSIVLTFPPHLIDKPITYNLIKDCELMVNILKARIIPKESGRLVIEMDGKRGAIEKGEHYLTELGIKVESLAQEMRYYKE